MPRRARLPLVVTAVAAVFWVSWLILPGPFGRGVLVGIFAAAASLFVAMVVFGRVMRKKMAGQLRPPPLPTGSWDYVMEITDLQGAPASLEASAGHVLVLNFWATWCAPCVAEMPSLERLQEETADLGVQFGLVTSEDPQIVKKFFEKRDVDLPVYILTGDRPECFSGRAIPATFVLDKSGLIAMRHFGAAAWDAEAVVAFVRGLAARP
jgi:thiol-disulfide isomerase/thioredoxin